MKGLLPFLCLLFFGLISCSDDGVSDQKDPSNLNLDVSITEDGSGRVEITAHAENALEYHIDTGESNGNIIINTDGMASHTYATTGLYSIEVKAYGNSGRFLSKSRDVSIQVGEVGNPINAEDGYSTPLSYEGMTMIWQDEFNGTVLNEGDWNYETGTGNSGWGNNELQYYRQQNTSISRGFLFIEAKKETFSGQEYTSSRLTTQNKFDFKYGRVDIRAILPKGQGIWPALWMLGDNFSSVGWPSCGELDIMEMVGGGIGRDDTVHGTLHWDENGSYACTCESGNSYSLSNGIFNDEFHVFTILWDSNTIQWLVDDVSYKTVDITPNSQTEFHNEFFFIFNVAVGGNWPGSPNSTTQFPQQMVVDYVRAFQNN